MYYKISCVILFELLASISSLKIQDCKNKTRVKTICKLWEIYDMSITPEPEHLTIEMNIKILDIVDFDWTSKTMTLFIELWTFWKDPRITITDYSDEKEKGLILFHFESTKTLCYIKLSFSLFIHLLFSYISSRVTLTGLKL